MNSVSFLDFNSFLFLGHNVTVALFAFIAWRLGQECLTAFMGVCWILGNLFCLKQATLFGLDVITADVFAIGANMSVTLLHDHFGSKVARKAIFIGSFLTFFFVIMSQFLLWYIPNGFDTAHIAFYELLSAMPRIVGSSLCVSMISLNMNLYLYAWFKTLFVHTSPTKLSMISLVISQFFDTVLFSVFALYGLVHSIIPIIIFSFSIKCFCIFTTIPLIHLFHRFFTRFTVKYD